jgi:acetoin utilization protein AcuB
MPVERWMRQPVITVEPESRVADAVGLMRERAVRHLPVVDGAGRLTGIVTDRDLRQAVFDVALGRAEPASDSGALAVRDVMSWGVVTVAPRTELREAIAVMRERRLGALPVVDAAGHVVGILTERDLLHALETLLRERVVRPRPLRVTAPTVDESGTASHVDHDLWRDAEALD